MRLPTIPTVRPDAPGLPLWPPLLAARGPGGRSTSHAHHGMHVVLALGGELRVRAGDRGAWARAAGVVTAPDALHAIDASGSEVLIVFVDPESDAGQSMRAATVGSLRVVGAAERDALVDGVTPMELMGPGGAAWTARVVAALGGERVRSPRAVHPRVRRLLRVLQALPPGGDASLDTLARQVGLSPGRLMHVFTGSIGVPLRPYLAWLRLQRAAAAVVSGRPLGEAAHAAGFADAAHMSRAFRRMLGVAPSELRPAGAPAAAHGRGRSVAASRQARAKPPERT
ncbi:AraC family transcriptional regulator [Anaeromyxobacter sp. PSR-1]|uniref:AraC family transcriptional regulator n=1 Tax=Anaeromyxobacter sp. PSR-1 TaxID=1300915 RepID=UPI0005E73C5C|nr:AraC family transcriptional regulator [Anaeromyxobacter sp. PSR-1]GAO03124.1 HTH-type transcriptional repressor of iron proteins A [Anaeromyxobacter sp. PSR-1]